ncbi:DnaJ family molecular chaperone [Aeromicrobium sp. CF4.19]|uniref:J domain-containing protein n=1 Tax=Aeromicrobium sp. CF4.19 TaxID=3373082 RepID=UPI003EE54E46
MTFDEACWVLGIEPGTDYVTAHRAYRSRARESHPDTASPANRTAAADEMARINAAWRLLRDELQPPALASGEGSPHVDESEREEPAPVHRRGRRTSLLVAAAAVVVVGAGLAATQLGGGTTGPQDYVGACLDAEGGVVDCGGSSANVEVVEQVTTAEDCDGPVFADTTGATFFCTRALDA